MSDWAHPDFGDPCFKVVSVHEIDVCRQADCDERAVYAVEYTQRRGKWTYKYECGYCGAHLPPQAKVELEWVQRGAVHACSSTNWVGTW